MHVVHYRCGAINGIAATHNYCRVAPAWDGRNTCVYVCVQLSYQWGPLWIDPPALVWAGIVRSSRVARASCQNSRQVCIAHTSVSVPSVAWQPSLMKMMILRRRLTVLTDRLRRGPLRHNNPIYKSLPIDGDPLSDQEMPDLDADSVATDLDVLLDNIEYDIDEDAAIEVEDDIDITEFFK